jgi:hypothetical protein
MSNDAGATRVSSFQPPDREQSSLAGRQRTAPLVGGEDAIGRGVVAEVVKSVFSAAKGGWLLFATYQ